MAHLNANKKLDVPALFYLTKNVVFRWETEPEYCSTVKKTPPYDKGTRLVDFIDMVILDFLMSMFFVCCIVQIGFLKDEFLLQMTQQTREPSGNVP